jgi:hypothetical protein
VVIHLRQLLKIHNQSEVKNIDFSVSRKILAVLT